MRDGYVLILGSNHRRAPALRLAWRRLRDRFDILECSGAMRTPDGDGPGYLNAAVRIAADAALTPEAMRPILRAIEAEAGRVRGSGVCALDIDLFAACEGVRMIAIYKPGDLDRDYVRPLLRALRVELDDRADASLR